MTWESWLALTGGLLVLALVPGPGFAAVMATAVARGFRPAAVMAVGNALGDVVFLLYAISGLVLLAQALGSLFVIVKFAGAAYLIWLGIRLWQSAPLTVEVDAEAGDGKAWRSLLTGLAISLGNPKVIAFYLGFLPAFLYLERLTLADTGIAAATVFVVIAGVLMGYARLIAASRGFLTRPRWYRAVKRGSGVALISAGTLLATR